MKFTEPMTAPEDIRGQVERLASWVAAARAGAAGELRLAYGTNAAEVVPPVVVEVLESALNALKDGNAVVVGVVPKELTSRDAAALLNVSEAYVGTLVQEGKLAAQGEGVQRRLKLDDVLRFRESRDVERDRTLQEMVQQTEEDGGYPEWTDTTKGDKGR
ncbi:helix-turn-helix domain-containing protein [Pyxidicoccus sp. MSG2]|uniref:helix-turn-helix domain-containing protein n=1 Tax=Pyxidicoccus sp. MSG2 TaxID=2996790 RepID=UPI002271AF75|nr:helix-turn-helix domain-containing protein [Pyxidicoccus sp. MSG2]MCY1023963.1 helix-turn-helix domain-containing protein [Pyxidicoccus sp. MSG2]